MRALILAGGSGTRFWPLSRRQRPKQFLPLEGDQSLLQVTAARLQPLIEARSIWVCTTRSLVAQVRQQLPEVPPDQILAEPVGRNTAAAIGWSLSCMPDEEKKEPVAVFPADHRIEEPSSFRATLEAADTGYGYLELGETLDSESGLRRVLRFTEKPDPPTARSFFESGNYLWNAGIFVFPAAVLLKSLQNFQPELAEGLQELKRRPEQLEDLYRRLPAVSIDHGVMEHLDNLGTLALDCGWSDLGSWEALWEVLTEGPLGNVERGQVVSLESEASLFYADQGTIAALGVAGMVVVKTGDSVLIVPKERSQEIRRLVVELGKRELEKLL
jgi:mannose-1-phosphate guanylyltransferase